LFVLRLFVTLLCIPFLFAPSDVCTCECHCLSAADPHHDHDHDVPSDAEHESHDSECAALKIEGKLIAQIEVAPLPDACSTDNVAHPMNCALRCAHWEYEFFDGLSRQSHLYLTLCTLRI